MIKITGTILDIEGSKFILEKEESFLKIFDEELNTEITIPLDYIHDFCAHIKQLTEETLGDT